MRRPNALPWLLLSALVVALDQLSKAWVLATLPEFQPVPVIAGCWNWFRTYNTGAAFSLLSDAGGWQAYAFVLLALVISTVLVRMLSKTARDDWRTALPFALIVGGALGNVIDRVTHGHVIDFIQWYWSGHYWPAFNLADSAIVGGAVGIGLFGLLTGKTEAGAR